MTLCHTFSIACDLPKTPYGNYCKSGALLYVGKYKIFHSFHVFVTYASTAIYIDI